MKTETKQPDLIAEVEELLAKATPGPYALIAIEGDLRWRVVAVDGYGETRRLITVMPLESDWQNSRNNGLLFAAAPELLRRMVEEVKLTRREIVTFASSESELNDILHCDKCELCEDHHA